MRNENGIIKPERYTIKHDDLKLQTSHAEKDPNGQWIFDPDHVIDLDHRPHNTASKSDADKGGTKDKLEKPMGWGGISYNG